MLEFKVPEIGDKQWIDSLLSLSDYNGCGYSFGNIFSWKEYFGVSVARLDNALIIKSGKDDDFSFAYPAGEFDIKNIFSVLEQYCKSKNVRLSIYGATKEQVNLIEKIFPGEFEFIEDRSFFDYIYNVENLAMLGGKKFHGKRNHISKFNRFYQWQYEKITKDNILQCRQASEKWFELLSDKKGGMGAEKKAISHAFDNFDALGYVGGLMRVDGEIAAFTMGERLNSNTFCTHFEKALPQFVGAYTVMNNEFAKNELSSFEYVNREEDMGIEGLRKAKLSYYPDILLEKYVVRGK